MIRDYNSMVESIKNNPMTDEEVEQLNFLLEKFLGIKLGVGLDEFYDIPIPLTILPNCGVGKPIEVKMSFLEQGRGSFVAFANTTDSILENYFQESKNLY